MEVKEVIDNLEFFLSRMKRILLRINQDAETVQDYLDLEHMLVIGKFKQESIRSALEMGNFSSWEEFYRVKRSTNFIERQNDINRTMRMVHLYATLVSIRYKGILSGLKYKDE